MYTLNIQTCRIPGVWEETSGIQHFDGIHRVFRENLVFSHLTTVRGSSSARFIKMNEFIAFHLIFFGYLEMSIGLITAPNQFRSSFVQKSCPQVPSLARNATSWTFLAPTRSKRCPVPILSLCPAGLERGSKGNLKVYQQFSLGGRAIKTPRRPDSCFSLIFSRLFPSCACWGLGAMGKKKEADLMNVSGLAKEWDEAESVRSRLRQGGDLLDPESGPGEDIKTVVANYDLVAPMVLRMSQHRKKAHPPIDGLTAEVQEVFSLSKRSPEPEYSAVRSLGWRLRYMVCFVKAKVRRKEPSTES